MMHNNTPSSDNHAPECVLGDEILLAYLQGSLPAGVALLLATQYHMCPTTRERLKTLNAVAAAAVEGCAPREMKCCPHTFFEEKCLKAKPIVDQEEPCLEGDVPLPLRRFVGACFDKIKWVPVMPGIRQKRIGIRDKVSVKLLRVSAGVTIPEHRHRGEEYTLVLEGSFVDGEKRYTPGMVAVHTADEKDPHAPYADTECICLSVLTAPLSLSGFLGWCLNPLLRWNY